MIKWTLPILQTSYYMLFQVHSCKICRPWLGNQWLPKFVPVQPSSLADVLHLHHLLLCGVPPYQADTGGLPREQHQGADLLEDGVHHGPDEPEAEDCWVDLPIPDDHFHFKVQKNPGQLHQG